MGDLILVVDIGGGTTDFTLIAVTEANGELSLNRVAVGDHILLGGDNIDLALAGVVAQRLAEKGTRIDSRQHQALWANCRVAKEKLLEPGSKAKEQPVTILGKGTGLVGGTIKATLLAQRYRAGAGRRLPAAGGEHGDARAAAARRIAGARTAVRRRSRDHAPHGALPAAAGGHASSTARCGAGRAAWRARRTCCSTAACSTRTWCASAFSPR